MQISPLASSSVPTTTSPAASPRPLGTANAGSLDVFAGRVLRSGVTDIATTGRDLMREYFDRRPMQNDHQAVVGFVRNNDAWDAVELLTAGPGETPQRAWMFSGFQALPGVELGGVWMIADYGGDYSHVMLGDPD